MAWINFNDYGWNKLQDTEMNEFTPLPPGAYVCRIVSAEFKNIPGKGLMFTANVDICEGEFAGYFSQNKMPSGDWNFNAQFSRYALRDGLGAQQPFRSFTKTLSRQNPQFQFNENEGNNPAQFTNLICGFTFAQREYRGKNDEIKLATTLKFPILADDVRKGNFKIPDIDRLPPEKRPSPTKQDEDDFFGGTDVKDDKIPF